MDFSESLLYILPKERIKTRLIDKLSYASDAGFYKLIPMAVVQPANEEEIKNLFNFSHTHRIPVTFRAGGTSLSGQSITDGVLVDLSQHWRGLKIEENGNKVRVQPGVIGATVNAYLKKYKRKIGPDPSSINSAMMGGILSNNSSGMCCGVSLNSYHTLAKIRMILPSGKSYSTEKEEDYQRFQEENALLHDELLKIRGNILNNPPLFEKIRVKYQTKNTVGYGLNSFIDFENPLDILAHLLIGAEGTLGFIAEAVLETVPDLPFKATALLCFPDIYQACKAIAPLKESGVEAMELMDRASLRSIESIKNVPERIRLLPHSAAALLIEYQAETEEMLMIKVKNGQQIIDAWGFNDTYEFTTDPNEQAFLWKLRKGMFPAVGAIREQGTTVILEDIAFPIENLAPAVADLQQLFLKYHYTNAIIFGHAKDGNLHFVITQSFNTPEEITRYEQFIEEVVELVVNSYNGTLKAEHGTGRNMAPFVETEWGPEAYEIMKKVKFLLDPENLLNPGVIINEDKKAHLKNLKPLPVVDPEVDRCMECGYCEHVCPSRDLTTTPRRRIIVRRELALLKSEGKGKEFNELLDQYQYDGIATCAVDGLCASACPVDINTGDLIKRLRKENHSATANAVASMIAKNFKKTEIVVRFALKSGESTNSIFGKNTMANITGSFKKFIPTFPLWSNQLKSSSFKPETTEQALYDVLYFPTCISRVMGGSVNGNKNIIDTFLSVGKKAGLKIKMPKSIEGLCCGQAFSSKGFKDAASIMYNKTIPVLYEMSESGKLPIVLDLTSCTHTIQNCRPYLTNENQSIFDHLRIIDTVDFLYENVVPKVSPKRKQEEIVLHPVCSLTKMDLNIKFKKIAEKFASHVTVPVHAGCCGMAGDRGFLVPELTKAATNPEASEVKQKEYVGYYSSAKTCEMAMSEAINKNYESILYLVDEVL